jgi:hypothetical protein
MKNKTFLISITLMMIVCASCTTKKPQVQSPTGTETETIDFLSFETVEGDNIPELLIKKKEYIKLDASADDFLFKTISKIKICDNRIFILDIITNKLIVFDINGKGIGQVGRIGQGPGEYIHIHEFDVDNSGNIFFIDGATDRLFIYDVNLKFVSAKKMPFKSTMLSCLQDNKLMFGLLHWNNGENESRKIAVTDMAMKTEQVYLQYDEYFDDAAWIGISKFANAGDKILYNQSINDSVYEFSQDGKPTNAYFFDFGKQRLPNNYKKDLAANMDKFENYYCLADFIVFTDKYILGKIFHKFQLKNFIIDRNSKTLYICNGAIEFGSSSDITGYFDGKIISYIFPGKYDDIQAKDLPDDVKKYVEDENFVLCISTLK